MAKLQLCGLDCTRLRLANIEAQEVRVRDFELLYFGHVFGKTLKVLFRTPLLESPLPPTQKTKKPRGRPRRDR